MIQTVDVFCRVVDNLGDAGVCWRLSRQFALEHELSVRLWIDQPETLRAFVMEGSQDDALIQRGLIQLCRFEDALIEPQAADLVIETFGCDIPVSFAEKMARQTPPSLWINLEYLSAEDWVEGCHALPSPHPQFAITRWFFFPGFTSNTGGLLREQGLLERRDQWQKKAVESLEQSNPLRPIKVSLFCYDHDLVDALLDAFEVHHTVSNQITECHVFQGPAQHRAQQWIAAHPNNAISFIFLPWLSQAQFDEVLWTCDFNIVRGEDSFVRAQWAGKPFIWDIYPTHDGAHLIKMAAFLKRYREGWMGSDSGNALGKIWQCWVRREPQALTEAWGQVAASLPLLTHHAQQWCDALGQQPDISHTLLEFVRSKL